MYYNHNVNQNELKACHRTWSETVFLLWSIAFNSPVAFSVETEQHLSADLNHMLLCVFVVVIEAGKLEVCIHKQDYIVYIVEKLSEIHKCEWWNCQHSITINN